MVRFVHPAKEDISLDGVLDALADPLRLGIIWSLMQGGDGMSCCRASPCDKIPKSTLSNHFRILRESGLIRTTKKGVEHRNVLRLAEINERFPGLLKTVMKLAEKEYKDRDK